MHSPWRRRKVPAFQGRAALGMGFARSGAPDMLSRIQDTHGALVREPALDSGIVDSKRLQMFYVSVKHGSFAAAAQRMSVSPSAISHAMKALEEDLGCALFRRSGPQVQPTGAALRLLPMVENVLSGMLSLKSELAVLDGRLESLTIRAPASLMAMMGAGTLATFCECFPEVDLEIVGRGQAPDPALEKRIDFEIGYPQWLPDDVIRRDLVTEEFHAHVAPFHDFGQKTRVSPADLKRERLIIPDRGFLDLLGQHFDPGIVSGLAKWIVPDAEVARELARQGLGVAFLPDVAMGGAATDGTLVRLKLSGIRLRQTCCAWWSPGRPLAWMAEVFLSLLVAQFERPAETGPALQ